MKFAIVAMLAMSILFGAMLWTAADTFGNAVADSTAANYEMVDSIIPSHLK